MEGSDINLMTYNYWQLRWKNDEVPFHCQEANQFLVAHKDVLPVSTNNSCRFFVPLCGKSVDLSYLADCGYDVYGCEFIEKAIEDFFEEQNLKYTKTKMSEEIIAFKATEKNITLYQGDFFALSSSLIGKFDAVWDRGSLVAIDSCQREDYAKLMNELMAENCKYLLFSCVINEDSYKGPPHTVSHDEIKGLFGSFCDVRHLKVYDDDSSFVITLSLLSK